MQLHARVSAFLIGGLIALAIGASLLASAGHPILTGFIVFIAGIVCGTLGVIRLIGSFLLFFGANMAADALFSSANAVAMSGPVVGIVSIILMACGAFAIIVENKHRLNTEE